MKRISRTKKVLYAILIGLFVCTIGVLYEYNFYISTQNMRDEYGINETVANVPLSNNEQVKSEAELEKERVIAEIEGYREKYNNNSIIGRLQVFGTGIDTIFTQASDNEYYLDKNLYKKKDIHGSEFMDYRVNISDRKVLIFGHNSRDYITQFRELEKYYSKNFFNNNRNIRISSSEGVYNYRIFSFMVVSDNKHMQTLFTDKEWKNHIQYFKDNSMYPSNEAFSLDSDILVIQTCGYNPVGSYIIVAAYKI